MKDYALKNVFLNEVRNLAPDYVSQDTIQF